MKKSYPKEIENFFSDIENAERSQRDLLKRFQETHTFEEEKNRSFGSILNKSGLPWLQLSLRFPWEEMLKEAQNLRSKFVSHRSGGNDGYNTGNHGWEALCIHGLSAEKTLDPFKYGYKSEEEAPYQWTEIADLCPVTRDFFMNEFPCKQYYRVRFTIIKPGGYIFPHADRKDPYLWEMNLALSNPQGFWFRMANQGYVPFKNGRAFILDVSQVHGVINDSDEERVHMIVHGNPLHHSGFQEMIVQSYQDFLQSVW